MTAKEKAAYLAEKYWDDVLIDTDFSWGRSKKCALIAVDEIINELRNQGDEFQNYEIYIKEYWQEVKKEIEKL